MAVFDPSRMDRNETPTEPTAIPAGMAPESSSITRQSLHIEQANGTEGTDGLPKWLSQMMATAPSARLSCLALRFIQRAFQSEALHKGHLFACRRAILQDKLKEVSMECSSEEQTAQLTDNENEHRADVLSGLQEEDGESLDALDPSALAVEKPHSQSEAAVDPHDLRHQLRELAMEEATYEAALRTKLELTDRLLNIDRYPHGSCHATGEAVNRDAIDTMDCRGNDRIHVENGVRSDSPSQLRIGNNEPGESLREGGFVQESAVDSAAQHPPPQCCDDATAAVLNGKESSRFIKESTSMLKGDGLLGRQGNAFEIIQLEPEELTDDDPVLRHSPNTPTFDHPNNGSDRRQELRWFQREIQRYLWPSGLEQRIRHSLHGYVRPSLRSWRPNVARTGASTVPGQSQFDMAIPPEELATHTAMNAPFGDSPYRERVKCEASMQKGSMGVPPQLLPIHTSEVDSPLSKASYIVPKLPWRGTRGILLVRGAGDFMASEVAFSTF
ncbi:unnamed protein product [Phytomonas sp. Hart1]|nr:unnamed protein product [Phytomonas sp. Hart1]|eukprot:CCW71905.1 unnamed protein product [Phytomonas sp. isolate Hart1]